jgi:hypothetical protein
MTFMNIPLGQPYKDFKLQLQDKGFISRPAFGKDDDNIYSYSGKFIGQDAELMVLVSPKTKMVWKVNVFLPEQYNWSGIKSEFNSLCEKMAEKYGPPSDKYSSFSGPYKEGDGHELQAISEDKCSYEYLWESESGFITVKIWGYDGESAQLEVGYEDKKSADVNTFENDQIIKEGL